MRRRTTFLLAALALGLTLWAIFIEAQHHAIWEGAGKLFPTLEPSDIVALEVKIAEPGGTERQIRLEREGEYDWNLRHPIDFPAFLPRVQGLTWTLADLMEVDRVDSGSEAEASAIPGGKAAITIQYRTRQGAERTIEVGREYEVGNLRYVYVRLDGRDVHVTKAEILDVFSVRLEELRGRALFPIAPPDALELSVSSGFGLTRSAAGEPWFLSGNPELDGTLADPRKVNDLLVLLNSWGVERFITDEANLEDASSLEEYGLARPMLRVIGRHTNGRRIELEIGKELEGAGREKLVYVRHADRPRSIFAASVEPLSSLRLAAENYRTEHVFDLDVSRITRVVCRGESTFTIEERKPAAANEPKPGARQETRDATVEPSWVIRTEDGKELPGDRRLIHVALGELSRLLIEVFLPPLPEGASTDEYDDVVEITLDSGETRVLRIGPRSEDPRDSGLEVYRALRSTDRSHFLIETFWPQRISIGPWVFHERRISRLDPAKLYEIRVHSEDQDWTLVRLPGQPWALPHDVPMQPGLSLDATLVDDLIAELARNRFEVREFDPAVEPSERARLGIGRSGYRSAIRLVEIDGPYDGFRLLTLGHEVPGSEPRVWWAWSDVPAVPFLLTSTVARRIERLVEHLSTVTVRP